MPRRVPDDTTVEVWLERIRIPLGGPDFSPMPCTWMLIASQEYAEHQSGTVCIGVRVFREHLAYVDNNKRMYMDDTGIQLDPLELVDPDIGSSVSILFRIGSIRLGIYTLSVETHHCTCKSYQYLQTECRDRNCKHLNSLCRPSYAVIYTKQKQAFQLISESVPRNPAVYMDWIYSQKHDGIRVRVEGTYAWTRGGMKIDLSSIWTPPVGYVYDAELCTIGDNTRGHDVVLSHVLSGKIHALCLLVFDLFDDTGKLTHGQRLLRLWSLPIPPERLVRYHKVHLWRGTTFHDRLKWLNIGSASCEGVVVRNPAALYDGSGKRCNRSIFKIKKTQWHNLQEDHGH
jgi:ATP-dependent DNA ligase